jgi:hypothetical protein
LERLVTDDIFKLPGSSYAELAKIIRAYGHANDDAAPKDVAERAGIDPTIVSRNNAFLVSLGILTGGKKKSLTSHGRNLAQALDHEIPDLITSAWRSIASDAPFFQKIISAVKIRNGMDESSLRSHIAYTAGAPKKPASMTGAGSVIDVLKASGLLREDGGKIFATVSEQRSSVNADQSEAEPGQVLSVQKAVPVSVSGDDAVASLQIQVRINCTPADIPSLGAQLREMLDALRRETPETDQNDK